MALSIDYSTFVITVPKADTQFVSLDPQTGLEVRLLDLTNFAKNLADLQDNIEEVWAPTAFEYTAPVSVGGVQLAPVIVILSPYTVEFEDGQYAVNLSGANTNVQDKVVVNQVSVRPNNSAGLTYSKQVEDTAFTDARVWIDVTNGLAGTNYPRGTAGDPVNNLADAQTIIQLRRLPKRLFLLGSITVPTGTSLNDYDIKGASPILSTVDVDDSATTDRLVVESITLIGDLTGEVTAKDATSVINIVDYNGTMIRCGLNGTLHLEDNATVLLDSCFSEVPGANTPKINMGLNSNLMLRNYSGGIEIQNMTAGCIVSVDLDPGDLILGPTNTGGTLKVRGTGTLIDTSSGTTVVDYTVNPNHINEIRDRMGLNPNIPVTITQNQIAFGSTVITISGDGETVSVLTRTS